MCQCETAPSHFLRIAMKLTFHLKKIIKLNRNRENACNLSIVPSPYGTQKKNIAFFVSLFHAMIVLRDRGYNIKKIFYINIINSLYYPYK